MGTHVTKVEFAYQGGSDWAWEVRFWNDYGGNVAVGFRRDRIVLWDSVASKVLWTVMTQVNA